MFRKPKKKPSALRSSGSAGGGASSNDAHDAPTSASGSAAGKKRRRPRQNSSSSEEDNDNEEDTSGLLQQIRHERDNNKSSKKSSSSTPLLNTSTTSTTSSKKKSNKNDNGWMHQYKSNDSQMTAQEMATRTAEYHPTESNSKQSASTGDDNNDASASSQNAQIAALQKQPRNKFLAGPLRATTFVRTTARFDYQPDICKDYKETGFCGFGDTCIYLHDRGDTKTGWQMEQEYEEKKKKEEEKRGKEMEQFMNSMMTGGGGGNNKNGMQQSSSMNNNDEQLTEDGIPFACHLCRGPFQNPIVTTCGHYYCEKCMLAHVREVGTGCPICQKDTHGVLNHAQKLVAKKRRLVGRDGTWEEYLERSKGGGDGDGDDGV
ncbi:hypothetical protein ACHAXR_006512 [Thalassiosira sp. AJA248-18]